MKRDDQQIKIATLRDRKKTLSNFVKEFKTGDEKTLSQRNITRRLKDNGVMSKIYAKKPMLSKKNVKDILHFAAEYCNFDTK